jgi:hypothetical protein
MPFERQVWIAERIANGYEWHSWRQSFGMNFDHHNFRRDMERFMVDHLWDAGVYFDRRCEAEAHHKEESDGHMENFIQNAKCTDLASKMVRHYEVQILRESGKWLKDFVSREGVEALNILMSGKSVLELITQSQTRQEERLEKLSEADI